MSVGPRKWCQKASLLWNGYELAALFADDYRERAKAFPTTHNASAMELCDRQKASRLALAKEVRAAALASLGSPKRQ